MAIILGSEPVAAPAGNVYLSGQSNAPGSSEVVLINGEPSTTGYRLLNVDVGNPAFDKQYSGPRGTLGAVLAGETAQNRLSTFRLQAVGTSQDDLEAKLSVLWVLDEQLRRYGGTVTWRPQGGSFRMRITVLDSGVALEALEPALFVLNNRSNVSFGVVSGPYYEGEPLDIADSFSSDTKANYSFDAGAAGDVAVTGGVLTCTANATTEKRMIHTGRGYDYGDVQVTLRRSGAAAGTEKYGVILKRIDALNYLEAYADNQGGAGLGRIRLDKVVAGSRTNLFTTTLGVSLEGAPQSFWIRGRIEGIAVFVEYFTVPPSPLGAPFTAGSYTLSATEAALFGSTISGKVGLSWIPGDTSQTSVNDFDVQAYVYRNATLPDVLSLAGPVYGDATSLADLEVTPSGGSAAPIWAAIGWWRRRASCNLCWNGDFESTALDKNGWSVAAVTNISGAATSIARLTSLPRYGTCSGRIVCPATANTGASFRIFRRFKKGVTYTAEAWVHSVAGTTNSYLRLGNGGANDKASSANVALSPTWTLKTITWTPAADYDDAHVAVNIAAATGTTFEIDGVAVYEGVLAPTAAGQREGRGGLPPLGILEAENAWNGATANANFRSGFGATLATVGGHTYPVQGIVIDPSLLVSDDYTDTIAVEVFGRCETTSSAMQPILSARPLSDTVGLPVIYSEEFGNLGRSVVGTSSGTVRRFVRLGTLRLPVAGGRYLIVVEDVDGPTYDYLLCLPSSARALSPTGQLADATYPFFAPATSELTRRIRVDLAGTLQEPGTGAPASQAPGLGGALIELPPDNVEMVVKLSSLVPDNPVPGTSTEQLAHSATVHIAKTPRWRLGRSS